MDNSEEEVSTMGLRQRVKKGLLSVEEALSISMEGDYALPVRNWLLRRKKSNVSVRKEKEAKKPSAAKKKSRHKKKG